MARVSKQPIVAVLEAVRHTPSRLASWGVGQAASPLARPVYDRTIAACVFYGRRVDPLLILC